METMRDFAFHMRYIAKKFPGTIDEKYGGKDSTKYAKFIIRNAAQIDRKLIDFGLTLHGGTTPEKLREIFDRWAGIEQHPSNGKKREKSMDDSMGW